MEHSIQIRVRYCETDAMGFLHHSQFFNYFEQGRTELLRSQGGCYRDIEEAGLFLVVVRAQLSFTLRRAIVGFGQQYFGLC